MPIRLWRYQVEADDVRHIGPTAQDFMAAFGLGHDDRSIGTVDADGVALAAIQGLHQLVQEKEALIAAQERRIADFEEALAEVRRNVTALLALRR